MKLKFNKTGPDRQRLAKAIGEFVHAKPQYKPGDHSYKIGKLSLDQNGTLSIPPISGVDVDEIRAYLRELSFRAVADNSDAAEENPITLSASYLDSDQAMENFDNLLLVKGALIKKALKAETLKYKIDGDRVSFPWFSQETDEETRQAHEHFLLHLLSYAKNSKRVGAKENQSDNDKFTFRVFLIRIGMGGDYFKKDRKILLQYLSGDSAFRFGRPEKPQPQTTPEAEA